MMNMICFNTTHCASASIKASAFFAGGYPSRAASNSMASSPCPMISANKGFTKPNTFAFCVTKNPLRMKITCGPRYHFSAGMAWFNFNVACGWVWASKLSEFCARARTVLLRSLTRTCARISTYSASVFVRLFAPPIFKIAGTTAKLAVWPTVLNRKEYSAFRALVYMFCVSHIHNIAKIVLYCNRKIEREEKYCEIAARRLSQEVLPL